jgi:hypothetical protein
MLPTLWMWKNVPRQTTRRTRDSSLIATLGRIIDYDRHRGRVGGAKAQEPIKVPGSKLNSFRTLSIEL